MFQKQIATPLVGNPTRKTPNTHDTSKTTDTTRLINGSHPAVLSKAIEELESYRELVLAERERQARIKEKYGIRSLEHLIVNIDGDLIKLNERKEKGENVDLVIRNKNETMNEYKRALEDLKRQIVQERSLTMSTPRFIGAIRVTPKTEPEPSMRRDTEIERTGMKVSVDYERSHGRDPEDVSSQDLGFDIRSTDPSGRTRYIEVKARAQTGAVALTQNEWFKAKRFGKDYYLYVVYNTAEKPELYIIQNPAKNLEPEQRLEVVRYIIQPKDIKAEAESK